MDAFFRGLAAASAQQQHDQENQESSLRQMVLKHQLSSLKLQDALNTNELKQKFAQLGVGQDQSGAPTTPGTGAGPTGQPGGTGVSPPPPSGPGANAGAPSGGAAPLDFSTGGPPWESGWNVPDPGTGAFGVPNSLADHISALVGQRVGGPMQPSPPATSPSSYYRPDGPATTLHVVPNDPNSTAAPLNVHVSEPIPPGYRPADPALAGKGDLGTAADPAMANAGRVWLDPIQIPELGVNLPGQWYSAKAARDEEQARAIALKRAEQPLQKVGPQESVYDPYTKMELYKNTSPPANESLQQKYSRQRTQGDTAGAAQTLADLQATREPHYEPRRVLINGKATLVSYNTATAQYLDPATNQPLTGAITEAPPPRDPIAEELARGRLADSRERAASAKEKAQWDQDYRVYSGAMATGRRQQADAMKVWSENPDNFGGGGAPAPVYDPPTFDEWRAARVPALPAPGSPSPVATGASGTPKDGQTRPIAGYPGAQETFRRGRWIRTK
jgi:hypothetical protein